MGRCEGFFGALDLFDQVLHLDSYFIPSPAKRPPSQFQIALGSFGICHRPADKIRRERKDRAVLAAFIAQSHHITERFLKQGFQLGSLFDCQVHPDLSHHFVHQWIDRARFGAGTRGVHLTSGQGTQECFGHLTSRGIPSGEEQNLGSRHERLPLGRGTRNPLRRQSKIHLPDHFAVNVQFRFEPINFGRAFRTAAQKPVNVREIGNALVTKPFEIFIRQGHAVYAQETFSPLWGDTSSSLGTNRSVHLRFQAGGQLQIQGNKAVARPSSEIRGYFDSLGVEILARAPESSSLKCTEFTLVTVTPENTDRLHDQFRQREHPRWQLR